MRESKCLRMSVGVQGRFEDTIGIFPEFVDGIHAGDWTYMSHLLRAFTSYCDIQTLVYFVPPRLWLAYNPLTLHKLTNP